ASRFRARDEIRPQTADRYQDDVRADRRRFRLGLLFLGILLLRLSRRGGEQTDEEGQRDGETEGRRDGETEIMPISRSFSPSLLPPFSWSFHLRDADRFNHLSHRGVESDQGGARDDVVSDVEFFDLGYAGDRADVAVGQPVPRRDLQSRLRRQTRGGPDARQLFFDLDGPAHGRVSRVFVKSRVTGRAYFDLISAELRRRFDLLDVGIDEDADEYAGVVQSLDALADRLLVRRDVESAFGGDFLGALGHQRDDVRFDARGDLDHLVGRGHLDVEMRDDDLFERDQVVILNVTPVAPKMGRDAVGAGQFANHGGGHRVRLVGPARLTDRRYVINVDVQSAHRICPGDYST